MWRTTKGLGTIPNFSSFIKNQLKTETTKDEIETEQFFFGLKNFNDHLLFKIQLYLLGHYNHEHHFQSAK